MNGGTSADGPGVATLADSARDHRWPDQARPRTTPRRVVVGVNGSPGSLVALRKAAVHAQRLQADLEVVRVIPRQAGAGADTEARALLGQLLRQELPRDLGIAIRRRVERGDPGQVLAAVSAGAELLVIGGRDQLAGGGVPGGPDVLDTLASAACLVQVCPCLSGAAVIGSLVTTAAPAGHDVSRHHIRPRRPWRGMPVLAGAISAGWLRLAPRGRCRVR